MTTTITHALEEPAGGGRSAPGPGEELVIKCAGLTKIFKDFWLRNRVRAVNDISLDVRRGEVFGLLGPNGSGKSTTIKMILGLLHPTSGRIAVFGKRPDDVATKKLVGYLPEESYLYKFLNARETLEYYGRLFHQNRQQRARRIDMLLEMVGLEHEQRRPVGEYSKGMQRKIGLAQALINDPQLLILDEPTSGLDPIGTRQVKDLIIKLARRGKTILLCSHLLADVEDVCDRVAIMFGGKVRAAGTVTELLIQQNRTLIETSELDADTIQAIEDLLNTRGKAIERVDAPRQRLEQLFLDIVRRAQAEGLATHGATAGGQIARFLVEEDATGDAAANRVVEQLLQQGAAVAAGVVAGAGAREGQSEPDASSAGSASASGEGDGAARRSEGTAGGVDRGADASVIAALTGIPVNSNLPAKPGAQASGGSDQPQPPPTTPTPTSPMKRQDIDADLAVIQNLITPAPTPIPSSAPPASPAPPAPMTKPVEQTPTAAVPQTPSETMPQAPEEPARQAPVEEVQQTTQQPAPQTPAEPAQQAPVEEVKQAIADEVQQAPVEQQTQPENEQAKEAPARPDASSAAGATGSASASSAAPASAPEPPGSSSPARPKPSGGEEPDQSFIDALLNVPPLEENSNSPNTDDARPSDRR